ncbi:DUF4998 domain-containing protein [Abyssalbus ytuae]|uniref:DUF5013 domain-containing protein n=1 Tax=Abyssalbus ytuae TaxID=2926907 RepID=A0A9E7CU94_9FLAO|nr:DUF4998 domain-containing protein [Abyssalbus ytuae]UOB17967.1 DUF5013 domain-containing protein [Abyssalbus ytuae]
MKKLKQIIIVVFTISIVLGIYSCTSDTEYLKFTEGGEISYTATIDSLKIYPGRNRVQLDGLIIGDPKVIEVRVYWNSNKDSISIPVNRTANIDLVSTIIDGLDENIYNFVVRTFDAKGNKSIPVSQTASVYGDRYIASLFNRPINNNVLVGNGLTINFAEMDLSTGVFGSEVEYTNTSDELVTVFVDIDETSLFISDFKEASSYRYRTFFLPEENSIDDFSTVFEEVKPVPTPILTNAAVPFIAEETDGGRWGTLAAPWITNDVAKNHGGYGGWDEWNGNVFNLESGWGSPWITNGKIYQVVMAEPATFNLEVEVLSTNHDTNADGAYFVVAIGDGLPDTVNVETAPEVIGYKRIGAAGSYTITFTVDETTDISVGQVTTQNGDYFCNITSWEIIVTN